MKINSLCQHIHFNTCTIVVVLFLTFACEKGNVKSKDNGLSESTSDIEITDLAKLKSIQVNLPDPKPGEWLYVHNEPWQTFNDYIDSSPVRPTEERNKIYIKPIGEFDEIDDEMLNFLRNYIEIFFELKTELIKSVSDSIIPLSALRSKEGIKQIHTKYILNEVLTTSIPKNAIAYISVTSKDLYPKKNWNYVFGQANLKEHIGVFSIFRLKPNDMDSIRYAWYFNRMLKTTTHEISHIFSIKHCSRYKCLMNGSNSLKEADGKPSWLCMGCLSKLMWNNNHSIMERYDALIDFFNQFGYRKKVEFYRNSKKILLNHH